MLGNSASYSLASDYISRLYVLDGVTYTSIVELLPALQNALLKVPHGVTSEVTVEVRFMTWEEFNEQRGD